MANNLRDSILVLLAISPLLVTGLWFIASESFTKYISDRKLFSSDGDVTKELVSSVSPTSSRSKKVTESGRVAKLARSNPHVAFVLVFTLGSGLTILLWQSAKSILVWAVLVALLLAYRQRKWEARVRREYGETIEAQLPQMVQLISLLVSSGISPIKALELISQRSDSCLALEFRRVMKELESGLSVPAALDAFMLRTGTPGVRRFVMNLLVAIDRGAPLVPVMVALVRDFHSEAKTNLMRQAGRSEIALMVPVVFLLLPISVLFTLFPSMLQLQFFFS